MPRGARTETRADTAVAIGCVALSLLLLILPDGPRDRVAGAIRGNLVGPLAALQQRASLTRRAIAADDSLVRAADSLVLRAQRVTALEAENAQLRRMLALGRALRWGFVPAEALIVRGMGDDHTLLLSAGARAGVERLSAVVAADGIVGIVSQVDGTTSVAITWPNPDFRVSATTPDGSAFGIVSARAGTGAERFLLELRGVPFRSVLAPGTPIVSSGLGGVFPRGVLIGTVLGELEGASGWSRTYLVRPSVRPSDVTQVMILGPERNAEGVESVWRPQVESLLLRVAQAGDSLARRDSLAARDSASARDSAAVRDSAVADSARRAAATAPQAAPPAAPPGVRPPDREEPRR